MVAGSLMSAFQNYFRVVCANSGELRSMAFRIRGDVYCHEFHFEDESRLSDGQEFDDYDAYASHCLILHQPSNIPAGCVRVVPAGIDPQHQTLPMVEHCAQSFLPGDLHPRRMPQASLVEISRLVVHTEFRRRTGEHATPFGRLEAFNFTDPERRTFPMLSVALFVAATAMVVHSGRKHVYAMMELRLARLLRRSGLEFHRIGEITDFHGLRAAHHIHIDDAVAGLSPSLLELFQSFRYDLEDCHPPVPAARRNSVLR